MSEPQYIGALIGLFLLSIAFRALAASQGYLEAYLHLHYYPRPASSSGSHGSRSRPLQQLEQERGQEQGQEQEEQEQQQHQPQRQLPFVHTAATAVEQESIFSQDMDAQSPCLSPVSIPVDTRADPALERTTLRQRPRPTATAGKTPLYHRSSPFTPSQPPPSSSLSGVHHSTETSLLWPLPTAQPFVWQAEVSRAVVATAVVGIGYMLMLVVMTYNSAYFGVILAGVFFGEVYFGRWGRVRPIFPTATAATRNSIPATTTIPDVTRPSHQPMDINQPTLSIANYTQHPAASSRITVASRASSHGYSAMAHQSTDCAC
ncbi:hypothetical protein BGX31_011675 [Mortierella sp. GBA43]|nr:hypothetical protein BGX31_011675 [Mortierella sp. GBA43]